MAAHFNVVTPMPRVTLTKFGLSDPGWPPPKVAPKKGDAPPKPVNEVPSFLDDKKTVLKLEPKTESFRDVMFSKLQDTGYSKVISVIGATHSGKSMTVRFLQEHDDPKSKDAPLAADTSEGVVPTTSNVNAYQASKEWPELGPYQAGLVTFIDVEGGQAAFRKPVEDDDINEMVAQGKAPRYDDDDPVHQDFWEDYFTKRQAAVEEHLPRLAYVTSDVVVYVSCMDFANRNFKKEVLDVAKSAAVEGVVDSDPPTLLLIANKSTNDTSTSNVTAEFFKTHDRKNELLQYYQDVKCVCVPVLKFNSTDPKDLQTIGDTKKALKALVVELLITRLREREAKGNLYSSLVWARLVLMALQEFHATRALRMGRLLTSAMLMAFQANDQLSSKARTVFDMLFFEQNPQMFAQARQWTLISYACLAAKTLLSHPDLDRKNIVKRLDVLVQPPKPGAAGKDEDDDTPPIREIAKALVLEFENAKPCAATVNVPTTKGAVDVVRCTSSRRNHKRNQHTNPNVNVYKGASFFKRLAKVGTAAHNWEGAFQSPISDAEIDELLTIVEDTVTYLVKNHTIAGITLAQYELVLAANFSEVPPTNQKFPDCCVVCFNRLPKAQLPIGCSHYVCTHCVRNFKQLQEEAKKKFVTGVLDPARGTFDPLDCPVCKSYGNVNPLGFRAAAKASVSVAEAEQKLAALQVDDNQQNGIPPAGKKPVSTAPAPLTKAALDQIKWLKKEAIDMITVFSTTMDAGYISRENFASVIDHCTDRAGKPRLSDADKTQLYDAAKAREEDALADSVFVKWWVNHGRDPRWTV